MLCLYYFFRLSLILKLLNFIFFYLNSNHFYSIFRPLTGVQLPANAGDAGSIPGLGRSPEEGNGYPLPYSCLENPMDRSLVGYSLSSVQFSSVTQSCPTLCNPMNCSTLGLPVHHQLPEFTQTHVHRVSDAIQPSHPLSSPSPPTPNPSQHQSFPMSQLFA